MSEYFCDCGRTRVVVDAPATYPYSDTSASVQCSACGTYVKDYPAFTTGDCTQSPPESAVSGSVEALEAERELALNQLAAVDKALGPWQPAPDSTTGVVGRVQTILNLQAERDEWKKRHEQIWRRWDSLNTARSEWYGTARRAEVGREQANKERDQAREFVQVAADGTLPYAKLQERARALLAGVPGGGQQGGEDAE